MSSFNNLPSAVQKEVQENLEKAQENAFMRSSKIKHVRNFIRLKKKYNFKVLRMGMN